MASDITVNLTDLSDNIANQLGIYARDKQELINIKITEIAKKAVKMLQEKSPKKTGEYSKSWKIKQDKGKTIIFNKQGSLTHLLEHGHAKRGGGRVREFVHIKPVEDYVIKEVTDEIKKILEG